MKRMLAFAAIVLFLAGSVFAEEAVLIDFGKLKADIIPETDDQGNATEKMTQNRQTMMDYANVAGTSFKPEDLEVMKTSLAIANWDIVLASSSRNVTNLVLSKAAEATSKAYWGGEASTVLGVRVHFPVEPWNSWAIIKPPFDIPAYEPQADVDDEGNITEREGQDGITQSSRFEGEADDNGRPTHGYGVVKNVGTIKSVAVWAYGLNFPHGLFTILIDNQGNEKEIFMGYLQYDGWGQLIWNNPAYVQEVRNRDLRLYPLYPTSTPFVKFGGFRVQRDAAKEGGDFITYFKDVQIIYDKAVLDTDRDIDDEGLWKIIYDRETEKKRWEMQQFGHNQVMRYIDRQKQATEAPFGSPERRQQEQEQQQ
ncbi:MAG: flagellar filament outer layer protein FlaA [Treponema sp.]|jgi:hypothetical protein|nr:flagellar filament outer layer protein FlaA [Treponema sp.]